tara:strand:- start:111 stop:785 length:675 start_codon:yes stop_codon:yes gene_type:complete
MSKPGKVLKGLCKRLGVRLTVKRGKKRVYKSVKVLKAQCKRKKKKKVKKKRKVKRRRKFGSSLMGDDDKWKAVLHKNPKYCEICNQDEKTKKWCRFDSKDKCESFLQEYDRPLKPNYTKKGFYFPTGDTEDSGLWRLVKDFRDMKYPKHYQKQYKRLSPEIIKHYIDIKLKPGRIWKTQNGSRVMIESKTSTHVTYRFLNGMMNSATMVLENFIQNFSPLPILI